MTFSCHKAPREPRLLGKACGSEHIGVGKLAIGAGEVPKLHKTPLPKGLQGVVDRAQGTGPGQRPIPAGWLRGFVLGLEEGESAHLPARPFENHPLIGPELSHLRRYRPWPARTLQWRCSFLNMVSHRRINGNELLMTIRGFCSGVWMGEGARARTRGVLALPVRPERIANSPLTTRTELGSQTKLVLVAGGYISRT